MLVPQLKPKSAKRKKNSQLSARLVRRSAPRPMNRPVCNASAKMRQKLAEPLVPRKRPLRPLENLYLQLLGRTLKRTRVCGGDPPPVPTTTTPRHSLPHALLRSLPPDRRALRVVRLPSSGMSQVPYVRRERRQAAAPRHRFLEALLLCPGDHDRLPLLRLETIRRRKMASKRSRKRYGSLGNCDDRFSVLFVCMMCVRSMYCSPNASPYARPLWSTLRKLNRRVWFSGMCVVQRC